MDLYPDDDLVPGLEHCIFQDHDTNVQKVFAEETASFSEPSAQLINSGPELDSNAPVLLLEKMGVSDLYSFCTEKSCFQSESVT